MSKVKFIILSAALAKDSKANYLLTGDKDLLILKTFDTTQIVTITEFQTIIT